MFELTAADQAQIAESIIRDFRQKRFLREGDLVVNEELKKQFGHNANIRDLADKEVQKARNDLRQLTIAIAVHENRYAHFRALAEREADEADRGGGDIEPLPFPMAVEALGGA